MSKCSNGSRTVADRADYVFRTPSIASVDLFYMLMLESVATGVVKQQDGGSFRFTVSAAKYSAYHLCTVYI